MQRIIKSIIVILVIMTFCLTLAGCQSGQSQQTETPKAIHVSYSTKPLNIPAVVALEKKLFEEAFAKDGIEVKWYELEGPAITEALAAGSIDIATSLNYVSAIISKANGNDITVLAGYNKFPKGIGLVAGLDSEIKTVSALKGKKVAVQKGTMLYEMVIKALAEAELTVNDVEIVGMASADALTALLQKQVDAAVIPDPLLTKGLGTQKIKMLRNAEGLILAQSVIAGRTDFITHYPETTKRFLEIHQEILDWIQANPDEAMAMIAKTNNMDIKAVKALYPKFDFTSAIDVQNRDALKESARFMKENALLKNDIDTDAVINDLVDTSYLPQ
ncbi:aliphatic sulfonate ABC transporter substrate-binding protein [Dehalobacter sp. DCM]|uniref:ABC transporter substrate-binding protein n=1 Tax=Dehalobacter sp. DCM TaxID=2907827 RepID=UPI0030818C93|nr:aliphatic sulfonate ABC transporter substrate-binding protein [Dehalobacter sp. DCM]